MRQLGLRTLLFLREIEEASWSMAEGPCGLYLRDKPEDMAHGARKVSLVGQDAEEGDVDEEWLVFSRQVFYGEARAGYVEVAFLLDRANEQNPSVRRVEDSPLIVFLPNRSVYWIGLSCTRTVSNHTQP